MALKKLPGGVIVETTDGARLNEAAGVNLEAIHRQLAGAAAATADALKSKADVVALNTVRSEALDAKTVATQARSVASTAQSTAGAAKSTADNADARVAALESAAGFGPSTPTDGTISAYMEQADSLTSASASRHAQRRTRTLYPEDFGAKGDGITDDTAALKAWLASTRLSLCMGDGRYRVTAPLVSAREGRVIRSDGGVILGDIPEGVVLRLDGAGTTITGRIDGLGKARMGLDIRGGECEVLDGSYANFHAEKNMAAGIYAYTTGGVRVKGAVVRNVHSVGNGQTGDSPGAARGVYLGMSNAAATASSFIEGCLIESITGEEGDSIQIISTTSGGSLFGSMRATVRGNIVNGFTRRGVKCQASDVIIEGNDFTDLSTDVTGSEMSVINAIQTDGVTIHGNRVRARRFNIVISALSSGSTSPRTNRTVITDNVVEMGSTGFGIRSSWSERTVVTGNTVFGGATGIELDNVRDSVLRNNYSADAPIVVHDTCTNITQGGNRAPVGGVVQEILDPQGYAGSVRLSAGEVPSGVDTAATWTAWEGGAATHSAGVITPSTGRYHIKAVIAGAPSVAGGSMSVRLIKGSGTYIAQERSLITKTGLDSWSVSAVAEFKPGETFSVIVHQTSGAVMPLNITDRLARVQMYRVD